MRPLTLVRASRSCVFLALATLAALASTETKAATYSTFVVCNGVGLTNSTDRNLPANACGLIENVGTPATADYTVGTLSASARVTAASQKVGVEILTKSTLDTNQFRSYVAAGFAEIRHSDLLRMTAVDAQGNPILSGTMDIELLASGTVSLVGSAVGTNAGGGLSNSFANLDFFVAVDGNSVGGASVSLSGGMVAAGVQPATQPVSSHIQYTVSWSAGRWTQLDLYARGEAQSHLQNDGSVEVNIHFGNSLDWVGVSNVRDANGALVGAFTLVNGNGEVWGSSTAVPEPAAAALLGSGLAGLTARARRRHAA